MARPPLDVEAMRSLAERLAGVNKQAKAELRGFISGETRPNEVLSTFRAVVRELVTAPTGKWGGPYRINPQLRADVLEWAVTYGLGKETEDPKAQRISVYWPGVALDAVDRAAELAGVDRSTYIRRVTTAQAERDLAEAGVKAA